MIYITYYTTPDDKRKSSPAANAKAISISKALAKNGIDVKILSTCTVAKEGKFIKGRKFKLQDGVECKQYALYNTSFGPFRRLQYYFANIRVFTYLLLHAKKGENVLFYHAIERSFPILLAKKIKKFRLILEAEEIYSNASKLSEKYQKAEYECLNSADAYIFPTIMLNEKINVDGKPYCIIHGTYDPEPIISVPNKEKIHVVYAGTLDPNKGGAVSAVESSRYLNENYHLHILGFGTDDLVVGIREKVAEASKHTDCTVTYDGCLLGEEYSRFVQECNIGLSTQNPNANFNDTSFPSKILSYMANGLRVVTVRIPVVESSDVNDDMIYYDEQTPEKIAEAIMSVNIDPTYDPRKKISMLNKKFCEDIKKVL